MMRKCSSSQGDMVLGPCSCGLFHGENNSFSMLFSMPNHKSFDETDMYRFTSSSSSSVDCTLSLGTPSTRLCVNDSDKRLRHGRSSGNSCVSNFCLDLLQNKNMPYPLQSAKDSRGSNGNSSSNSSGKGNDPLLARRCANCDTTSTPLWRNGPRGPKLQSLCNACGIRFRKEERRATNAIKSSGATGSMLEQLQHLGYHHHQNKNNSRVHHSQNQKKPCFSPVNGFRVIEDTDRDSATGIPFLSWRLNVHDLTR
ncbi:hypothetical protein Gorai_009028 [Gossypium raimondii]|uniref:GATA-type domain-containing protein n=1 Tax=Gossypium raimondii TaxID=29730 RepID=A0A7J8PRY0_GOSRA|nr:hypothetical protein [Gossypium raimondii]